MEPVRVRPERVTLAAVLVALLGAIPLAASKPWLAPLGLVPLAWGVWVLRAKVTADAGGLSVCNGLGTRTVAWAEVDGFDLPRRGPVQLRTTGGDRLLLTPVDRRDLPRLLERSAS